MFDAAVHLAFDARIFYVLSHFRGDLMHISFPLGLALRDFFNKVIIDIGFQIFERKVIQFHLDLGYSEPGCDRRIDVERLLRDADLLLGRHVAQRAHIVEAVCELDQNDTDILGHCKEHLAKVSRLFFLLHKCLILIVAGKFEFFQFSNAVNKQRNI